MARRDLFQIRASRATIATLAFTLAASSSAFAPSVCAQTEEPPRPFVFAQDARTLPSGTTEIAYSSNFGFGSGPHFGVGVEQLGHYGSIQQIEIEAGFLNFLSVRAVGLLRLSPGSTDYPVAGGLSVRARVLGQNRLGFQLTADLGVFLEFEGSPAVYGVISASDDMGPMRVTFNVTLEHSFAAGSDLINTIVQLAAMYRITQPLWFGVEYLGQDLLAGDDPERERGPRNLLGPVLSYSVLDGKLQMRAGVLGGLTHLSPDALVRLTVAYSF